MGSRPHRASSLRLELLVTLAAVLMLAVVGLSLTSELLGRERHREQEAQRIGDHTRSLAVALAPRLGGNPMAAAQRGDTEALLRPVLSNPSIVGAELLRIQGDARQQLLSLGLAPDFPAGMPEPRPGAPALFELAGEHYIVVDEPVRTFGGARENQIFLRVWGSPSAWTTTERWGQTLLVATAFGGLLLLLGGVLVEFKVIRPLRAVRVAAEEVASGKLDIKLPERGPAEFDELSRAFNAMTEALAQKVEEIASQREALVRAEQLASVGRVAAGVAHEVGNPLAAILGYVELLLDPRTDPPLSQEQREMLERASAQIQRIRGTVGQLLEYSRPVEHQTTSVDLDACVRNLLELLQHDPVAEGVDMEVDIDAGIRVVADQGTLEQILQNLVSNACRAMSHAEGAPRVVTLTARDADSSGHTAIEVADTGRGVATDHESQIFEPFFTTAKAGEGTGLGLAICRGLAESMHGTLELASRGGEKPGLGARFRLKLPRDAGDRAG